MFFDARQLPENTELDADICVIGAGAAGITIAREFSNSRYRIILLEGGGFEMDLASQSLYEGSNVGLPYEDLHQIRSRYFGGSTNCWGGWCRPFDDIDFEKRDWIPHSGWPFGKSALESYYERAHEICNVGPNNYDLSFWADVMEQRGLEPLTLPQGRVVTQVTQLSSDRKFGHAYRKEIRDAANIQTYLHANVLELQTDAEAKAVKSARVGTLEGNVFQVSARVFVLATGGIENPRILLLSNSTQAAGLGNQHDLVGRFFMENPRVDLGEVELNDPNGSTDLYDGQHNYFVHSPIAANLALTEETQRKERILNYKAWIFSVCWGEDSRGGEALRSLYRAVKKPTMQDHFTDTSLGFWARNVLTALTDPVNTSATAMGRLFRPLRVIKRRQLVHTCEPAPNPDSRVKLSHERDRLGLNQVDVDWRMGLLEKKTIRRAQGIIADEIGRSGLGNVNGDALDDTHPGWPPNLQWVWHHMGTTRMHDDPRQGVVDANCLVHGMSNLFVAGSSVFPTGGSDMPTMTIVALALRLAEYLDERFEDGSL